MNFSQAWEQKCHHLEELCLIIFFLLVITGAAVCAFRFWEPRPDLVILSSSSWSKIRMSLRYLSFTQTYHHFCHRRDLQAVAVQKVQAAERYKLYLGLWISSDAIDVLTGFTPRHSGLSSKCFVCSAWDNMDIHRSSKCSVWSTVCVNCCLQTIR